MKIITVISTTKGYRDAIDMVVAAGKACDGGILISRDFLFDSEHVGTRVITPARPLSGLGFWIWAANQVRRLLREEPRQRYVLVEHVVGITCFILRYCMNVRVPCGIFLVFPTLKYVIERGWASDPCALPMGKKQSLWHIRDGFKRSVIDVLSLWSTDAFVANSNEILISSAWVRRGMPSYILPNSVRPLKVKSKSDSAHRARPRVILVAAMMPHKGIAMALAVTARVREMGFDFDFDLVGGCNKADEEWLSRKLVMYDLAKARYLGRLAFDQLAAIYLTSDIFLFPSFYEGSPRVVQEAMQYGCQVVCSDLDGSKLIDPNCASIIFFRRGDLQSAISALISALRRVAESDDYRSRSAQIAAGSFSAERVGEQLVRISTQIEEAASR